MKKIKILFAINNLSLGGAEVLVTQQINNINRDKFDPYLATLFKSKRVSLENEVNLPPEKIARFDFADKTVFNLRKLIEVCKFMKAEKFDAVYSHLFESNSVFRVAAILLRVPVILSFEHSLYSDRKFWQILLDKILAHFSDRVMVATKIVRDFVEAKEGIGANKFVIVPNPVSLPDRSAVDVEKLRAGLKIPAGAFVVITLGRYAEEKGQTYLIKAAEIFFRKNPEASAYFLFVGYGAFEKKLREEISQLGLEEKCLLVVEPHRAKEYLYLADVFALPSLREGQSIAIYEAMAAGLPVVAFPAGGVKDIIAPGGNGFFAPEKDSVAMAEKLEFLYKNKDEKERMSKEAIKSVAEFTVENNLKMFERLVEEIHNAT